MTDELDATERTRLALTAQAQRLEETIEALEAQLEEDDNPGTRRRVTAATEKLAEVQQVLLPLSQQHANQLLEDFQKALSGLLDEQLAALRHVWRKYRHPRVAHLIDHVSDELAATLPPVPTGELPALFAKRDPTEVSRLLRLPWPTNPELEELVLQAILWLPDDPRVAAVCAGEVDLRRLNRGRPAGYGPLFERLNELGDLRQLPLLERQLARPGRPTPELDLKAVAIHKALRPVLPPEFETLVDAFEARWAGWVERREARDAITRRHLDSVLALPQNLTLRSVFADSLAEQGDPRGEFISLQLAPPSRNSARRQQELLDAYRAEWLRAIVDALDGHPSFEGGFPVSGQLSARVPHLKFEEPEWRTFTSLHLGGHPAVATVRCPNLCSLRELRGVLASELQQLLHSGAPLTSISVLGGEWAEEEVEPLHARDFAAMPTLQRLDLDGGQLRRWVNQLPTLQVLRVHVEEAAAAELSALLEAAPVATLELAIGQGQVGEGKYVIRLERDADGSFTRAICTAGPRHLPSAVDWLPAALTSFTSSLPLFAERRPQGPHSGQLYTRRHGLAGRSPAPPSE